MNTIDTTLYNLRPRPSNAMLAVPPSSWSGGNGGSGSSGTRTPGGHQVWSPRMWKMIDNEMNLRDCAIYCYQPEEDPFDGEEGSIWSMNYFFFNKHRKRVCYVYLRGLSIMSHSPAVRAAAAASHHLGSGGKRGASGHSTLSMGLESADKRAMYWLGDRAEGRSISSGWPDDDDDVMVIPYPGDDEVDADEELMDYVEEEDEDEELEDDEIERQREKSAVRDMSEHIADTMEV
ncbi:Repressor of RNA polymerase III transcription MAF1-like protein [Diplodia seriata]|nr:Repressor of RNA polymerase III transcription MAF1-like protein [Diplodia seriata]